MAKKKGGGKKGGGKKSGASGADKLSPHEALLAHQVNIHQQNNIQISDEIDQLKVEREKLSVTQKIMNNEVNNNVGELLKRDKSFEENALDRQQDSHNEVRTQRQTQIQLNKDLDGDVDTCLQEISQVEINCLKMKHEIENREKFYKNEYVELTDKVKLLEKRLSEMVNQFDEMKANLNSQVENSRLQEEDRTQTNLEKQRLRAIEYAIERLPPQQAQELRENRWLLSEASVHRDQIKVQFVVGTCLRRKKVYQKNIIFAIKTRILLKKTFLTFSANSTSFQRFKLPHPTNRFFIVRPSRKTRTSQPRTYEHRLHQKNGPIGNADEKRENGLT